MPPEHSFVSIKGAVTDVFGHRFAVASADKKILADLGPKGAEQVRLAVGDPVTLTGEQKPSEVKVHSISVGGREYLLHTEKGSKQGSGDETTAVAAVKAIGFEPEGKPSRHPKHFEILGRRGDEYLEFHVEFDGSIRKTKPGKPSRGGDHP
jgi:hypothetical protein